MTDAMISNAKKCLKNLTKCEEIYSPEDPMGDFGKAIKNYYQHYTDDHTSTWCRFHKKVVVIHKKYFGACCIIANIKHKTRRLKTVPSELFVSL